MQIAQKHRFYSLTAVWWGFVFCFFITIKTVGQLKVESQTIFTVKNTLSTKEETNIFEASVLGNGQVSLVGNAQKLRVASGKTLHTLHIHKANNITIETPLSLNGNLIIDHGTLQLHHPIDIKGSIQLGPDATILGTQFINHTTYKPFAWHTQTTLKIITLNALIPQITATNFSKPMITNSAAHRANTFIKQHYLQAPIKPPPQLA